jgi:hypothetical protein
LLKRARVRRRLFADQWRELEEEAPVEEGNEGEKKYYVQKYTIGIPPAEAILIEGTKPRFLQIIDGKAELSEKIPLAGNITLCPLDKWSYLSKEYEFSSLEEINTYVKRAKEETLDSLYDRVKSIWKKYVDADDFHIAICAADTLFTYFQDKLGMTHYLLFLGDNNVGKTNNVRVFQQLAYRPLYNISVTPANIYRSLGSLEEGQVTIVEDEIDSIEERDEKMTIYKAGYNAGTKVQRSDDTSSGRKSQSYYTYCFKAFTSEKQPDSIKAKGFNERVFVIKCSAGDPDHDISEVISAAGDEDYKLLLDELVDIRKVLLVYRLLHYSNPVPNVKLTIKNRDKQLCKPLIRLFRYTRAVRELKQSLSRLLSEKKERKANTVDARVYTALTGLAEKEVERERAQEQKQASLDKDTVILPFGSIWDALMKEVEGTTSPKNPRSMETAEYGLISQQSIGSILRDRFGCEDARDNKTKKLRFSRAKLEKLGTNYSSLDKIEIIEEASKTEGTGRSMGDQGDPGDQVTGGKSVFDSSRDIKNGSDCTVNHQNTQEEAKNTENIAGQEPTIESPSSTTGSPWSPGSPASSGSNLCLDTDPHEKRVASDITDLASLYKSDIQPVRTPDDVSDGKGKGKSQDRQDVGPVVQSNVTAIIVYKPEPRACLSEIDTVKVKTATATAKTADPVSVPVVDNQRPTGDQGIFPHNLDHDRWHILDGMLVLRCLFCKTFQTPIEYDMRVHLRDTHQKDLVTKLPLQGKGYDLNYRTQFAIDIMKQNEPQILYDHKTAKIVPIRPHRTTTELT